MKLSVIAEQELQRECMRHACADYALGHLDDNTRWFWSRIGVPHRNAMGDVVVLTEVLFLIPYPKGAM